MTTTYARPDQPVTRKHERRRIQRRPMHPGTSEKSRADRLQLDRPRPQQGPQRRRVGTQRPQPAAVTPAARQRQGWNLEKSFIIFGFAVAVVLLAVFGADLTFAEPFDRIVPLMSAAAVLSSLGLAYLSWDCWQDQHTSRRPSAH